MNALKNLRLNAKRIRIAQGLSQEALAERAKLEYKHYQKIEAGHWPEVYLSTAEAIAKALGVNLGCLLDAPIKGTKEPKNLPGGRPKKVRK